MARHIYETGTQNGKRVQALGGAKNHMVVLPDADIEMAADAAVSAAYGSAGERCMAISVVRRGRRRGRSAGRRDRAAAAEDQGRPRQRRRRRRWVRSSPASTATRWPRTSRAGQRQGATLRVDGRQHVLFQEDKGFFLGVSLLDNVTPEMECYRNEIFGPVLEIVRVPTYADAMQVIDDNPYANGTAIYTRDGGAARQFQFDVNVGMVGINVPIPVPVAYYSFGGWKASLFGDLHMYGPEGVQFYTRAKVVTSRWPDPATSKVDLGFPRTR